MGFEVGMTVYKPGMPHRPGLVTKIDGGFAFVQWGDDQVPMRYPIDAYEVRLRDMDKEIERRKSELRAWKWSRRAARRYK